MKSFVVEGKSVADATEKGWLAAGSPTIFSVKVVENIVQSRLWCWNKTTVKIVFSFQDVTNPQETQKNNNYTPPKTEKPTDSMVIHEMDPFALSNTRRPFNNGHKRKFGQNNNQEGEANNNNNNNPTERRKPFEQQRPAQNNSRQSNNNGFSNDISQAFGPSEQKKENFSEQKRREPFNNDQKNNNEFKNTRNSERFQERSDNRGENTFRKPFKDRTERPVRSERSDHSMPGEESTFTSSRPAPVKESMPLKWETLYAPFIQETVATINTSLQLWTNPLEFIISSDTIAIVAKNPQFDTFSTQERYVCSSLIVLVHEILRKKFPETDFRQYKIIIQH